MITDTTEETKRALEGLIVQQSVEENDACAERLTQRAEKYKVGDFVIPFKELRQTFRQLSRYSAAAASG